MAVARARLRCRGVRWGIARRACLVLALGWLTAAGAGVAIESVDDQGRVRHVYIAGDRARIDRAVPDGYMILDLARGRAYAVDTTRRLVVDLGTPFVPRSAHADTARHPRLPAIALEAMDDGPEILGHATRRYRVTVAGHPCYEEFLARDLATDPRIHRFLEVAARLSDSSDEVRLSLLFNDTDPCDAAADTIDDRYPELGLPMRRTDARGRISYEIVDMDLQASVPASLLGWSPGYPVLSRQQVHDRLQQRARSAAAMEEAQRRQRRIQTQIRDLMQ